jgi:hypothetical protein
MDTNEVTYPVVKSPIKYVVKRGNEIIVLCEAGPCRITKFTEEFADFATLTQFENNNDYLFFFSQDVEGGDCMFIQTKL